MNNTVQLSMNIHNNNFTVCYYVIESEQVKWF